MRAFLTLLLFAVHAAHAFQPAPGARFVGAQQSGTVVEVKTDGTAVVRFDGYGQTNYVVAIGGMVGAVESYQGFKKFDHVLVQTQNGKYKGIVEEAFADGRFNIRLDGYGITLFTNPKLTRTQQPAFDAHELKNLRAEANTSVTHDEAKRIAARIVDKVGADQEVRLTYQVVIGRREIYHEVRERHPLADFPRITRVHDGWNYDYSPVEIRLPASNAADFLARNVAGRQIGQISIQYQTPHQTSCAQEVRKAD